MNGWFWNAVLFVFFVFVILVAVGFGMSVRVPVDSHPRSAQCDGFIAGMGEVRKAHGESMLPTASPGDFLYGVAFNESRELRRGDYVGARVAGADMPVGHRVTSVEVGDRTFRMKGDNNLIGDFRKYSFDDIDVVVCEVVRS